MSHQFKTALLGFQVLLNSLKCSKQCVIYEHYIPYHFLVLMSSSASFVSSSICLVYEIIPAIFLCIFCLSHFVWNNVMGFCLFIVMSRVYHCLFKMPACLCFLRAMSSSFCFEFVVLTNKCMCFPGFDMSSDIECFLWKWRLDFN